MKYHQSQQFCFGSISIPEISAKHNNAYRKLHSTVQEEADKEKLLAKAVQRKLQGQ